MLALVVLCLAAEAGALLFFDFIPRDIGRASNDFIFSIAWISGLLFLFFHAIQTVSWKEERSIIYTLLARPISRSEYVLGLYLGLSCLLILLNLVLGILGWFTLKVIQGKVLSVYFLKLSPRYYLLSWAGLTITEMLVLAVVILLSSVIRGGFIVLLLSIFYCMICSGLPVVREAFAGPFQAEHGKAVGLVLKLATFFFPDFDRLDFKQFVTSPQPVSDPAAVFTSFSLAAAYIAMAVWAACMIYQRRDLK